MQQGTRGRGARPGGPGKHQPTEVGQATVGMMPSRRVYTGHGQPRPAAFPTEDTPPHTAP
jgi:hypothetical protein